MKGYNMLIILFFTNLLFMYNICELSITNFMLEFIIISTITKVLYTWKKELVGMYSLHLVNSNENSIWFVDYPLNMILPWKFSLLFLTEYIANCDREYSFIINNWDKITFDFLELEDVKPRTALYALILIYVIPLHYLIQLDYYTQIIIICYICQSVSTFLYFEHLGILIYLVIFIIGVVNKYLSNIQMMMLLQIIINVDYIIRYIKQTYLSQSVNTNSLDFPAGYFLSNRKLFYLNFINIMFSLYLCL